MTVPSSFEVILPSPSLSKREKASLNSAICSSLSCSTMVLCWFCVMLYPVAALVDNKKTRFFFLTRTKDQSITPQDRKGGKAKIAGRSGGKKTESLLQFTKGKRRATDNMSNAEDVPILTLWDHQCHPR